jgi:type VI secretion system secreted protein Hcp
MPSPAYLTIVGVQQGNITEGALTADSVGTFSQDSHANEILIQAFEHQVFKPTDPQTRQPTGPRVHNAVKITKIYDKASPLLFNALCTGEQLPKVEIKWFRTTPEGQQEHYFTHTLEQATIVDIESYMPNCLDPSQASFTHMEKVQFAYKKITWTHEVAGTSGGDDWSAM